MVDEKNKVFELTIEDVRNGKLEKICKGLSVENAIGLSSKVSVEGAEYHIPQLDFIGDKRGKLPGLKMPGIIVLSGSSYHFYGSTLLNRGEWINFMEGNLKLTEPYQFNLDKNYIEIHLKKLSSSLRITPAFYKPYQPCFCGLHKSIRSG